MGRFNVKLSPVKLYDYQSCAPSILFLCSSPYIESRGEESIRERIINSQIRRELAEYHRGNSDFVSTGYVFKCRRTIMPACKNNAILTVAGAVAIWWGAVAVGRPPSPRPNIRNCRLRGTVSFSSLDASEKPRGKNA